MSGRMLTENKAPTFGTTTDARLDFFFHITEDAKRDLTLDLLKKSWKQHPLDTLKLIAYLRDCRNGKGIRNQYQMCLSFLFSRHFKTLMANMKELVAFGYWKDPLVLLMVILFDFIPDYLAKDDGRRRTTPREPKNSFPKYDRLVLRGLRKDKLKRKKEMQRKAKEALKGGSGGETTESSDVEMLDTENEEVVQTVPTRSQALIQKRRDFARKRFECDHKFRALFDEVVDLFANQLVSDLEAMARDVKSISLAGKWAPTNGHHFDKYLSISQSIATELWRRMKKDEPIGDTKLVSDFYQKEVCAPLRKYLKIPEVYMASNKWSDISYNRVASKCMQKNKSLFIKHDKQRFEEYLNSKTTISGAVLKPVEMVNNAYQYSVVTLGELEDPNFKLEMEVLEKQWLSLCEDIQKKGGGLFDNAIAVCDVSGSMNGTPMDAAIGLTILVMYLSREPWNSMCITFHESPSIHVVDPKLTFIEKLRSLQNMSWGGTTNLDLVFDLILNKAVEQRLTNDQLPKVLIVFTDMEFSTAFHGADLTNFEAAKQRFERKGYKLPPIVFWNLRASPSTPVQTNELGAALLSGYSGQQLQLLLKTTDMEKITPFSMMRSAIDNKRYNGLKIVD